jgi:hypothetical protein
MNHDTSPWPRRVGALFALWFVTCAVCLFFGLRPHPFLLALVIAAAAGAVLLLLDASAQARDTDWQLVDDDPQRAPGEDPRLSLLARVIGGQLVAHDVGDQLHRHLMSVVDQRLMAHHGVSRVADPEGAARLMGPALAGLAARSAPYPRLTPDQIDVLIDRIEEL